MHTTTPIQNLISKEGWRAVSIEENNEPLISLKNYAKGILLKPMYFKMGLLGAIDDCLCRHSVAKKLEEASLLLPKGYKLLVFDAWRPIAVQHDLFERFKNELHQKKPQYSEEMLLTLVQHYVSLPSADPLKPSPHVTGGAIDLSIVDQNNNLLNMGTGFDFFGSASATQFYELKSNLTMVEIEIQQNRRLLFNVMIAVGFTNYCEEWWHFDYGNQFWGLIQNKNAIYGPVKN